MDIDGERSEQRERDPDDRPSLRQRFHALTGDREREAQALVARSRGDVTLDDARIAVNRAHGDDPEVEQVDTELASPADAEEVHAERRCTGG